MNALFQSLTGQTLLHPWLLLVLLLVVPAVWLLVRGSGSVPFAPSRFVADRLPRTVRGALRPVPLALHAGGLVLLVVALARPVQREPVPPEREGIDILLCLDVSSSMTATDMDARRSRLDIAREAAARFVEERADDRIGLIRFARFADVRCPPTLDHAALGRVLADVETVEGDGPEDATGIGSAVARAAQVLQDGPGGTRIVVLLTDGEENVATTGRKGEIAPSHAAQLCAALGVKVYAVAAGDVTGIDTGPVARMTEKTGGAFFLAPTAADVTGVFEVIDELEKAVLPEPRFRLVEGCVPFVLAGLLLLMSARVLSVTVLRTLP